MLEGYVPYNAWPDSQLRQYRLYKELLSPEERRDRYQLLILSGAKTEEARKVRDWSEQQYDYFMRRLNKLAEPRLIHVIPFAET